jgi:DNA-binding winged helix-turn-helix (wHTH) protein
MAPIVHIRFGVFDLNLETGELSRRGRKLKLSPKPFRVLALLAASPGRLVTREAIQKELWGSDTFVDFEHALNFCIREIRCALGEKAKKPRFIETLPRRGYRFIAAVSNTGPATGSPPADGSNGTESNRTESNRAESNRLEAYECYSRARKNLMQMGKDGLEQARVDFERAVTLDPGYAMAHAGLGGAYALRSLNRRVREDLDQARLHLQRALELDRELAEPYPWLCYVHMRTGQIEQALAAGQRAIQLQPNLAQAHYFLGLAYFVSSEAGASHYQNAANHLLRAMQAGPGWQASWFVISFVALLNGDYEHAEAFAAGCSKWPLRPQPSRLSAQRSCWQPCRCGAETRAPRASSRSSFSTG